MRKTFLYVILNAITLGNVLPGAAPSIEHAAGSTASVPVDITYTFSWVKSGTVYHQMCDFITERLNVLIYKANDGKLYYLLGKIDSMNIMLAGEVSKENARIFLEKDMTDFIKCMLSNSAHSGKIVTESYFRARDMDEQKILQQYVLGENNLSITGNEWMINLNVITREGGIEAWTTTGTVSPLAISMFSRKLVKPGGTIRMPTKDEIIN